MKRMCFQLGNFYHIYNRGVEKRKIFLTNADYQRFLKSLYWFNDTDFHELRCESEIIGGQTSVITAICAYCLMPNHFHFLLKEIQEGGITNFMRKLSTGYTLYFNEKYKRTGHLFQSAFRSVEITNDEQLKHLTRYIHLNPAELKEPKIKEGTINNKKALIDFLENYEWSSYKDFIERRDVNPILNKRELPIYFDRHRDYRNFVYDWIDYFKSLLTVKTEV